MIRVGEHRLCFASLASGRRAEVRFVSQGCDHREGFEFDFAGDPRPHVHVTRLRWDRRLRRDVPEVLGEILLSEQDLRRLDGLLRAYRSGPPESCTTGEHFRVAWIAEGRCIAEEGCIDYSGSIFDADDTLRLDTLASRLLPDGPRERLRQ